MLQSMMMVLGSISVYCSAEFFGALARNLPIIWSFIIMIKQKWYYSGHLSLPNSFNFLSSNFSIEKKPTWSLQNPFTQKMASETESHRILRQNCIISLGNSSTAANFPIKTSWNEVSVQHKPKWCIQTDFLCWFYFTMQCL